MRIVDCTWEKRNFNTSVVELSLEKEDCLSVSQLEELSKLYGYHVIKVPVKHVHNNFLLAEQGYALVEMQFHLKKDIISFGHYMSEYQYLFKDVEFQQCSTDHDFQEMINCITSDMFITDRIALDPLFGTEIGRLRYINWMKDEFLASQSEFWWILYKNIPVGFMMLRVEEGEINCLLNGLFSQYHHKGLGILTPASPLLMAVKKERKILKEVTSISSNNPAVVHLYNKLNFQIKSMEYVFVKHFDKNVVGGGKNVSIFCHNLRVA